MVNASVEPRRFYVNAPKKRAITSVPESAYVDIFEDYYASYVSTFTLPTFVGWHREGLEPPSCFTIHHRVDSI